MRASGEFVFGLSLDGTVLDSRCGVKPGTTLQHLEETRVIIEDDKFSLRGLFDGATIDGLNMEWLLSATVYCGWAEEKWYEKLMAWRKTRNQRMAEFLVKYGNYYLLSTGRTNRNTLWEGVLNRDYKEVIRSHGEYWRFAVWDYIMARDAARWRTAGAIAAAVQYRLNLRLIGQDAAMGKI